LDSTGRVKILGGGPIGQGEHVGAKHVRFRETRSGREVLMRVIVAALFVLAFDTDVVRGSACTDPIERQIRLSRGSACWHFAGTGTSFVGSFQAGQKLKARASGEYRELHRKFWVPWQLSIIGPDNALSAETNFDHNEGEPLTFVIPQTRKYRFDIVPRAVWGYVGKVEICKVQ
jgi:hypothetical protein